jgi:hypothetical protein
MVIARDVKAQTVPYNPRMSLNRTKTPSQQHQIVDDAVCAYVEWREECTAVWDAYRRWTSAPLADAALAFGAYASALDREQGAAKVYAGLMRHVGHLVETGLDYPISHTLSGSGA